MKIAIVKLAALGDVLRTTCLLKPLHRKFPSAEITWFTKPEAKPLLENNPWIYSIRTTNESLPSHSFDLVLGLDEDEDACTLSSALSAARRIGAYKDNSGKFTYTEDSALWFDMGLLHRDPDGGLTLANALKKKNRLSYPAILWKILELDGPKEEQMPIMFPPPEALKWATEWVHTHRKSPADIFVGINSSAGSRWPTKQLRLPKTVEVIHSLHRALPHARFLLLGGPEEHERNQIIMKQCEGFLLDPGTSLTLPQFAAILGQCQALITSDSLSLHVGLAMGRPVYSFFGPTSAAEIEIPAPGLHWLPTKSCECFYLSKCRESTFCLDTLDTHSLVQKLASLS